MDNRDQPTVSCIIIFYNAERFIQEAIDSVFAQTYCDWELLLVDDGSVDRSSEIAHRVAEMHPERVRVVEHEGHGNRGMSASRNLGIRSSHGKYLAFVDSDDVWTERQLEQQVAILDAHPDAAGVFGKTRYWYGWTREPADLRRDFVCGLSIPLNRVVRPPSLFPLVLSDTDSMYFCMCSLIMRREAIERVGRFEEAFHGLYEDMAFHAKIALQEPLYLSDETWGWYRQHSGSSCAMSKIDGRATGVIRARYLEWLESYLDLLGVRQGKLRRIVDNHLWWHRHSILNRLRQRVDEERLGKLGRRLVPHWLRGPLQRRMRWGKQLRVGKVDFGDFRRVSPIGEVFGETRGRPIDRYYIENFLDHQSKDVRGHVLEIGEDVYTKRFGGEKVTANDILHVDQDNQDATIVADLSNAGHIPSDMFDCIIFTQTLQLIYDVRAALRTLYRILKPGGVVLATVPGITQIDEDDWGFPHWHWSFTSLSTRKLFNEVFPPSNVTIGVHGNVLAAISFLHGLVIDELKPDELDAFDPHYEVVITVRAVKRESNR